MLILISMRNEIREAIPCPQYSHVNNKPRRTATDVNSIETFTLNAI